MLRATRLKTAVAFIIVISLLVFNTVPVVGAPFQDITGHWAKDSILRLASLQIVNGYNGNYSPASGVTRAEFTAMMVKALGFADQAQVVAGSSTGYTDVPGGHWAAGFLIVAREKNIISGYPDGTFKPSALIRRDEITSVLVRALNLSPSDNMQDPVQIFADGLAIPGWARDTVKTAYNYNLIKGFPDHLFYPGKDATRGETAVLIEKVLEQLGAEFTFSGRLQSVNQQAGLLTLDILGQEDSFAYRTGTEVRINGAAKTVNRLKPGMKVNIILDQDGYINFIEASEASAELRSAKARVSNLAASPEAGTPQQLVMAAGQPVSAMIVSSRGAADRVAHYITSNGGEVKYISRDVDFITASVSPPLFQKLQANPLVAQVSVDRQVKVETLASEDDETTDSSPETNPGASLNVTKEAIKAPEFVQLTHSDGKNQVIAVIDTGVDPGHPDLQKASDDRRKIVDWQDFTNEGDIDTSSTVQPVGKYIRLVNGSYYLGEIISAGGLYKYGYLREADIIDDQENIFDINYNGNTTDLFAVVLVDSENQGVYDTVYIDTDNDKDFSDETALEVFSRQPVYASFSGDQDRSRVNVAVTEINKKGTRINLGFDGNQHGTHVAGIAAANGKIKGVAPGAQIMVLKALDTAGYGNISTISKAITYAAQHGAKIINLSLGFPVGDTDSDGLPIKLLNNITEQYGVIFVIAAGNDGPGLTTTAVPAYDNGVLSVGAFNTPKMWKTDYGWDVPAEGLWFFSSAGPRRDGGFSPSIVAPGSVISTVPRRDGEQYWLSEGTSMAVPHVSGAVALLLEVADRNRMQVSPQTVKRSIELGARPITGYQAAEQGFGALDMTMSWAEIVSTTVEPSSISVQAPNIHNGLGTGVYFREGLPGRVTLYLKNNSNRKSQLTLQEGPWIKPGQSTVNIPPGQTRAVDFDIDVPDKEGLFSSFITGDDFSTYDSDLQVLTTVINPYELSPDNSYSAIITDTEKAAQYKRYFFRVPAGTTSVNAKLTISNAAGRAMAFLYNPSGQLISETDFAGANPQGNKVEVNASGDYPEAGVWEAVVYSSAALSAYGVNSTDYTLQMTAAGVNEGNLPPENRSLILGIVPKTMHAGQINYLTVQVADRNTKRPFEGFVEINGKLYFSRGGKVTLPVATGAQDITMVIRTVPDAQATKPWEITVVLPVAG